MSMWSKCQTQTKCTEAPLRQAFAAVTLSQRTKRDYSTSNLHGTASGAKGLILPIRGDSEGKPKNECCELLVQT